MAKSWSIFHTARVNRVGSAMSTTCPVTGYFRKCWFAVDDVGLAVIQAPKLEARIMRYD